MQGNSQYEYCAIVVNEIAGTEVIPVKSQEDALAYLRDRAQCWENPTGIDLSTATLSELSKLFADGETLDTLMLDIGTIEQPWEPGREEKAQ